MILKRPAHDDTEIAPHFVEWVRESLAARYSTDEIWRKGLQVYTTLNIQMQKSARKALQEGLRDYDKKRGWRGPIGNVLNMPSASIATYSHPTWRRNIHPDDIVVGLVEEIGNTGATVRIGVFHGTLNAREIAWTKAKSVDQILKPGDLAYFKILSLDEETPDIIHLIGAASRELKAQSSSSRTAPAKSRRWSAATISNPANLTGPHKPFARSDRHSSRWFILRPLKME